jgi:hypothetical protein
MTRRIILSITLVLSIVLVLQTGSDSRVAAQNQIRIVADTGLITLGPVQNFNVAADGKFGAEDVYGVRFRLIRYGQTGCGGGICRYAVVSQTTSDPISLAAGESVSSIVQGNLIGTDAIRVIVLSNSRDVQVNGSIIDAITGAIITSFSWGAQNPVTGLGG